MASFFPAADAAYCSRNHHISSIFILKHNALIFILATMDVISSIGGVTSFPSRYILMFILPPRSLFCTPGRTARTPQNKHTHNSILSSANSLFAPHVPDTDPKILGLSPLLRIFHHCKTSLISQLFPRLNSRSSMFLPCFITVFSDAYLSTYVFKNRSKTFFPHFWGALGRTPAKQHCLCHMLLRARPL